MCVFSYLQRLYCIFSFLFSSSAFIFAQYPHRSHSLTHSLSLDLFVTRSVEQALAPAWQTNRKISYQWLFHPEMFRIDFIFVICLSSTHCRQQNHHHTLNSWRYRISANVFHHAIRYSSFATIFFSFVLSLISSTTTTPTSTMILLSLDLISCDFLSIFSHFFGYATGFTDQLLSLWFVCLAIFFPFAVFFSYFSFR